MWAAADWQDVKKVYDLAKLQEDLSFKMYPSPPPHSIKCRSYVGLLLIKHYLLKITRYMPSEIEKEGLQPLEITPNICGLDRGFFSFFFNCCICKKEYFRH